MLVRRLVICGALLGAVIWSGSSNGATLHGIADGWHTWQVDEPGAFTTLCCFARTHRSGSRTPCDLDSPRISWSNNGDCAAAPGPVRIYVHIAKGVPQHIIVLSALCQISPESELIDHGLVTADENLGWFRTIVEDRRLTRNVRKMALFALVQSNSDRAYAYIDSLLSQG